MRAVESVEVSRLTAERQFRIHEWPVGGPPSGSSTTQGVGSGGATSAAGGNGGGASGAGTNHVAAAMGIGVAGGSISSIGQGGYIPVSAGPSTGGSVPVATQPSQDTSQAAWNPMTTTTQDGSTHQSSSSSHPPPPAPPPPPPPPPPPQQQPQPLPPLDDGPKREKRFLRVRDFSPYALTRAARAETKDHPVLKSKGKCRAVWRTPKIVKDASRVYTKGVFKEDIMSSLPYVETVTDETFDVTDVMMDDGRLLLLKRGPAGRINQMEVLMM